MSSVLLKIVAALKTHMKTAWLNAILEVQVLGQKPTTILLYKKCLLF